MAKQVFNQNAFNAGEFSPDMYGRFDLDKYSNALKTLTNAVPKVQGPLYRRTGAKHLQQVAIAGNEARLIPFQYDSQDGIMIEVSNDVFRFYTAGAPVFNTALNISTITNADPAAVTTSASHGLSTGDSVVFKDVDGMIGINNRLSAVTVTGATTFTCDNIDSTSLGTYTANGTANEPVTVSGTGYDDDTKISELQYAQFGNTLYLAQKDTPTKILTRINDTSWNLETMTFSPPPSAEEGESGTQTLTLGATTGTNITATAGAAFFQSGDVGRQIVITANGKTGVGSIDTFTSTTVVRINITEDFDSTSYTSGEWKLDLSTVGDITITPVSPGTGSSGETITVTSKGGSPNLFRSTDVGKYLLTQNGVAKITVYNSATSIECVVQKSLNNTDDTSVWSIEEEEFTASRGYPRAVAIRENRLALGGTSSKPQDIWLSESGIFNGHGLGSDDEDGINVSMGGSEATDIRWILSGTELTVGTTGTELTIEAPGASGLSPTNIEQQDRTTYGSAVHRPVRVDNEVVFIPSAGKSLRTFKYDFNVDDYTGENLLKLSEHLLENTTIKEIAVARQPNTTIFAVLSSGDMIVGTYSRQDAVIGWSKWTMDGSIENVQVMTDTAFGNLHDNVYLIVNRTDSGIGTRHVEILDPRSGSGVLDGFSDSYVVQEDPLAISGITQADPGVVTTSSAHGLADGDEVIFYEVVGMTELNTNTYTVANKTSTTFELTNSSGSNIDTSSYTAFTSGNVYKKITAIGGLGSALDGASVEIKADGGVQASKTVSNGQVTLDSAAGKVTLGVPYTTNAVTLRKPFGARGSSGIFGAVRPISIGLLVTGSKSPTVNGEAVPNRNGDDNMDDPVPLFDGFYEYAAEDWNDTGELSITASGPFPFKLLGIFGYYDGSDK